MRIQVFVFGIPCERLQLSGFLIRLPSSRGWRITLKHSFLVFMLTPKVLRQWMFALVCVLWDLLFLFCNNTVVNSNWSHGLSSLSLRTDWSLCNWFLEMEVGDFLSFWRATLVLESWSIDTDETPGDSLHEGQLSVAWDFGGSVSGFKAQKLRFLPSSLAADEVKGFSFARRVIWMQLSDRVARRGIHQSFVHAVLIPTFSGSLFWSFWNSAQLEGPQAQCAGAFWTFTLCKLCALAATKFYVQKISLQYSIDCGRRKGVWKYPYPVDAIHNTMSKRSPGFYVSTLCSPWWSVFFLHEDVVVLT